MFQRWSLSRYIHDVHVKALDGVERKDVEIHPRAVRIPTASGNVVFRGGFKALQELPRGLPCVRAVHSHHIHAAVFEPPP